MGMLNVLKAVKIAKWYIFLAKKANWKDAFLETSVTAKKFQWEIIIFAAMNA